MGIRVSHNLGITGLQNGCQKNAWMSLCDQKYEFLDTRDKTESPSRKSDKTLSKFLKGFYSDNTRFVNVRNILWEKE